jgi:hypothetical protein
MVVGLGWGGGKKVPKQVAKGTCVAALGPMSLWCVLYPVLLIVAGPTTISTQMYSRTKAGARHAYVTKV